MEYANLSFKNILILVFLIAATSSVLPDVSRAEDHLLTLETAISTALENNPDIRMTRTLIKKAEASVKKTEAVFWPRVTAFSELSAGDAPSAFLFKTIDQRKLPPDINFNDPGSFTNMEVGIMAGINLYNGGQNRLKKQLAQKKLADRTALALQTENDRIAAVIQMFFTALKAREYILIARTSVQTVEEQLDMMMVRFRGGSVLKSDILSLKVRLAEAKKNMVESKNTFATTLTALATLLGHTPGHSFSLDPDPDSTCVVTFPVSIDQAWALALEKRPELHRAKQQIDMARTAVSLAASGYRPRVDLQARWYMDSDDLSYNRSNDNYTAGLNFAWNLFDGFATRAQIAEARHELERALEARKKIRMQIYQDVKQAYLQHENAQQRLLVARSSVEMAEASLHIVKKRYNGGAEPVTRYLEAELDRTRAGINKAAAFYDGKTAKIEIARAIGTLSRLWSQEK
ncbi:MAG TPA: TolC family protein [Desulfobacter sp.]|nr:TolC family protein [Desulfobacter sp.]